MLLVLYSLTQSTGNCTSYICCWQMRVWARCEFEKRYNSHACVSQSGVNRASSHLLIQIRTLERCNFMVVLCTKHMPCYLLHLHISFAFFFFFFFFLVFLFVSTKRCAHFFPLFISSTALRFEPRTATMVQ